MKEGLERRHNQIMKSNESEMQISDEPENVQRLTALHSF